MLKIKDGVRAYIDKENNCVVFVEDKKEDLLLYLPEYCHECESTGLVDIEPDDVPHGSSGYWVNKHGARYFMAYCDCDAGSWRRKEHERY